MAYVKMITCSSKMEYQVGEVLFAQNDKGGMLRMTKRDCRSEPAMTERCPVGAGHDVG